MGKLNVKALGLSLGITWGVGAFLMGILSMCFNWGTPGVELLSSMYIGYDATIRGSLIGAAWGFVDADIWGILIAWIYNKFSK